MLYFDQECIKNRTDYTIRSVNEAALYRLS
jgi:hypothetical protein